MLSGSQLGECRANQQSRAPWNKGHIAGKSQGNILLSFGKRLSGKTHGASVSNQECSNKDCPHRDQVQSLRQEMDAMRKELADLRAKLWGRKRKKPPEQPEVQPKKRGAPKGHKGWFRAKPDHINETIKVTLDRCSECGSEDITAYKEIEEHIQEDIVMPAVKVTRYLRYHYECRRCGKVISGVGPDELPGSYIGPKAKALAVWLKYVIKISDRDLVRLFDKLFNLKIVVGSVFGFKNQVRRSCFGVYQKIRQKVKQSRSTHSDETGWRIDGQNAWLWGFVNKVVALCHIDYSRGRKVLHDILGENYGGILIADFLSVYNKLKAKAKQRCLVHLLRELKNVLTRVGLDTGTQRWCEKLKDLIHRALALRKDLRKKRCSRKSFLKRRKALERELQDFTIANPSLPIVQRLAKRITRHKDELFTFLHHPSIDPDNNRAERHIRPNVLLRKLTFGNRSASGVLNHNVLMSVLQTAALHKQDGWEALHRLMTLPAKQRTLKIVTGARARAP